MLYAKVQNRLYEGFTSYSVKRSIEDLAGEFELGLASEGFSGIPFQRGQEIQILIDKTPVLTGYIEDVSVTYDSDSHEIKIGGRDKIGDWVDTTIGTTVEFKPPVTLEKIIETIIKLTKATGVKIINKTSGIAPFTKDEIVSGTIDETVLDFLEKYTRKRQILLSSDGLGNVVLTRSGQVDSKGSLFHYVESEESQKQNNIKSGEIKYNDADRYYQYRVHSQGNPSADKTNTKTTTIVNRVGIAYDDAVRKSRVLDLTNETSGSTQILAERAKYEANIRRIRSMSCSYDKEGHTVEQTGKPWEPNTLVKVVDEFFLLDSSLLIKSVEYSLDLGSGSETKIEVVHPDAYQPEPTLPKKEKKTKALGRKKRKSKKSKHVINQSYTLNHPNEDTSGLVTEE